MPDSDSGEGEEPTMEAAIGREQESAPEEQTQEGSRVEPTEEHDRQMLALLDEAYDLLNDPFQIMSEDFFSCLKFYNNIK